MSTSETRTARALAAEVRFGDDALRVRLSDGREVSLPLEWFPALRDANPEQRARWRMIGGGVGIQWSDLDEDISVEGLLRTPASGPSLRARAAAVRYFVGNQLVHSYPVPPDCRAHYADEELHGSPPADFEKCGNCFRPAE
jgi:hypothetical protein